MPISYDTTRGGTRLVFDSVELITRTVENMHRSIARTALPCPTKQGQAHGIDNSGREGLVFLSVSA